jgi:hypothetical protein
MSSLRSGKKKDEQSFQDVVYYIAGFTGRYVE